MPEDLHAICCETRMIGLDHVAGLLRILSQEERDRHHRFAFTDDSRDYVAAHALLRLALGRRNAIPPGQVRFGVTASGKPFMVPSRLRESAPSFSLAHSRGLVACVVGGREPVGIDVEPVDSRIRAVDIARRIFSPGESMALEQSSDEERATRFCELWTLKEAMAKARGIGITESLRLPGVDFTGGHLRLSGAKGWTFVLADVGRAHKLAIACTQRARVCLSMADPAALVRGVLSRYLGGPSVREVTHTPATAEVHQARSVL
jgi:4'-phosphopantetheinyl transferase